MEVKGNGDRENEDREEEVRSGLERRATCGFDEVLALLMSCMACVIP